MSIISDLEAKVTLLATRVAAEFKSIRTALAGKLGNELAWNGSDYVPAGLRNRTDIPRTFKGPVDPASTGTVTLNTEAHWDTWVNSDVTAVASTLLGLGEACVARDLVGSGALTSTSGVLRLAYFTARKTEPVTKLRVMSGTTAASGLTFARIGVYSIADNGDGTLVTGTQNDTTMLAAASTTYERALNATWSKAAGQRYAYGILQVGTTPATLTGQAIAAAMNAETALAPRLCGNLTNQSALPASFTDSSLAVAAGRPYLVALP